MNTVLPLLPPACAVRSLIESGHTIPATASPADCVPMGNSFSMLVSRVYTGDPKDLIDTPSFGRDPQSQVGGEMPTFHRQD
jgi:hypothetical protein